MKGRTVLVTGANTGIGFETAAQLAGMGARTVLTARDPSKGEAAVDAIRTRHPDADVACMELDLSRLSHVRDFAKQFADRHDALHVLINNAGAILDRRALTVDGNETTFQVNHLGPFLLTNLLLDLLARSAPSRIVNVSSTAHRGGAIDFTDLQSEVSYTAMNVYGKTKLANILFTRELSKRIEGTGVTANSLHPGTVRTGFGRDGDLHGVFGLGIKIAAPFFLSPAKGARTSVYLASSPEVEGITGEYFVRCKVSTPSSEATDDAGARRLWELSRQLVGLEG